MLKKVKRKFETENAKIEVIHLEKSEPHGN
jgi:hypothetical protein